MDSNQESSNYRDIIYAIRKIAGVDGLKKASFLTGTVTKVNEDDRTCDVDIKLGDSAESLTGVKLSVNPNDGFILIPAKDSDLLICLMSDNSPYMISCEDIDKVICVIDSNNKYEFDSNGFIINDGNNGGLINITQQVTKLNLLVTQLNTQLASISAAIVSLGGSYVPVPLSSFMQTDFEDTKVKH